MQRLWLFFFFLYLYFLTVIYCKEVLHRLYLLTKKDSIHSTAGCEDDICTCGAWVARTVQSIPLCDRITLKRGGQWHLQGLGGTVQYLTNNDLRYIKWLGWKSFVRDFIFFQVHGNKHWYEVNNSWTWRANLQNGNRCVTDHPARRTEKARQDLLNINLINKNNSSPRRSFFPMGFEMDKWELFFAILQVYSGSCETLRIVIALFDI